MELHKSAAAVFGAWVAAWLLLVPSIHAQEIFVPRELLAVPIASNHSQTNPLGDWKDWIRKGLLPYHKLTLSDFRINDKTRPAAAMSTMAFCHYQFVSEIKEDRGHAVARVSQWFLRSGFDQNQSSRKSYAKGAETKWYLLHEQGHLDINELHGVLLANLTLDQFPMGAGATAKEANTDLQNKVAALADAYSKAHETEQDQYDAKTVHGSNDSEQLKATAALQIRLKRAGIRYSY